MGTKLASWEAKEEHRLTDRRTTTKSVNCVLVNRKLQKCLVYKSILKSTCVMQGRPRVKFYTWATVFRGAGGVKLPVLLVSCSGSDVGSHRKPERSSEHWCRVPLSQLENLDLRFGLPTKARDVRELG